MNCAYGGLTAQIPRASASRLHVDVGILCSTPVFLHGHPEEFRFRMSGRKSFAGVKYFAG